jgi:hypothetical protein
MNKTRLLIALFVMSAGAGCKQGLGERCQVDSDCASGICSMATPKVCVSQNGETEQIDATVPCHEPCLDAAVAR